MKLNQPSSLTPSPDSYRDWERVGERSYFKKNKIGHYIIPTTYLVLHSGILGK